MEKQEIRNTIERGLIAILFNHNELIDLLQIKHFYLSNEENKKILESMIKEYQKNKYLNENWLLEQDNKFPYDTYIDIITNETYFNSTYQRDFNYYQSKILDFYKEEVISQINDKLNKQEINYNDFLEKIEKIKSIKINVSNDERMKTLKDIDLSKQEEKVFIKSHCEMLDTKIKGFILGELSVWSGSNGCAKSTYLNQIALESIDQGFKVAIFSGELTERRLLNWIINQCAGRANLDYNKDKDYFYCNPRAKGKIINWLNNKLFIYDNSYGNKAEEIIESIRSCIKKNNIKVIILDNLMSMNLSTYGDAKYDMQTKLITQLSNMAKEFNIHIHFVCHPRKSTTFLRKVDISGSADLTNIADNVFIMHRVNNDFKRLSKQNFDWKESEKIFNYTNAIEVCKNREFGVQDHFAGLFFEFETKRLLNYPTELRKYRWEEQ